MKIFMLVKKHFNKAIGIALGSSFVIVSVLFLVYKVRQDPPLEEKFVIEKRKNLVAIENENELDDSNVLGIENDEKNPSESEFVVPPSYLIPQATHVYQTFNNCGAATLSSALSYYNIYVDQKEIGDQIRPYQIKEGDNDDKTIFTHEFETWAKIYGQKDGLNALNRPNGDVELLKLFISNDIPVVVKARLNNKEDIGHFVIARGYNDNKKEITIDDSYYGPDRNVSYFDFLSLWQTFNYSYIILYDESQNQTVNTILSDEIFLDVAWENAVEKAHKERDLDPQNIFPVYNLSVGYFHLKDFHKSIQYFEKIEKDLPRRMMWYQIEPIKSYQQLGNYDKVFEITENILSDGNRAFSELYLIRGEVFLDQGKKEEARNEFEQAIIYNENYAPAKEALEAL